MKCVLVANRGEIALRIMRTCREMGLKTIAVASRADEQAPHARYADRCVSLGDGPVVETYLDHAQIIDAAVKEGADAIHPGYGFLSENADFARAVEWAGLTFIGPKPETIALMGLKRESKEKMMAAGVPVVPGYNGKDQEAQSLLDRARDIGFPVLIKASAGGGGKGMRIVHQAEQFVADLETAKREAMSAFGNDTVILEKYLIDPRHIEFQMFGDHQGNVVHLFERECSIQRRHQKIVEETPSPALDDTLRAEMGRAACAAAASVGYVNAGTVEFMLDRSGGFYFLEMNTRLQVEHPVTEMTCGVDLVRWQIRIASGEPLPVTQADVNRRGHAVEVRVYAEDPERGFMPQTGEILTYVEPSGLGVRMDSGVDQGYQVGVLYDPMLAKLIAFGADRQESLDRMSHALRRTVIHGLNTNCAFLRAIVDHPEFRAGRTDTGFLDRHFKQYAGDDSCLDAVLSLCALSGETNPSTSSAAETLWRKDPWTQLSGWRQGT